MGDRFKPESVIGMSQNMHPVDNMVASTGFAVLSHRIDSAYNPVFYLHITNDFNTDKLIRISESSKSSYPSISPDDILNIKIALPKSLNLLDDASKILTPIFEQITRSQNESKVLENLRDWLLPMLMNGQVTVSDQATPAQ